MQRCITLALLGAGTVAPNPMVGAVLVYQDRIIGEGYHQQYGQAHAEVNCIYSVTDADKALIPLSTLYVSLEPCTHFGKTPPCSDLIIKNGIQRVVIGCRDPFEKVNGKGIEKLQQAGITTIVGVLEKECLQLNRRFMIFHSQHRPFIVLKWAQTADGKIAAANDSRLMISNKFTNRLVHRWRTEAAAIMIGNRTALADNPILDNRLWSGPSPIRIVIDLNLQLPDTLKLFDQLHPTLVFNLLKQDESDNLRYYRINNNNILPQVMDTCYQLGIQSILVEGGARILQSFIGEGIWDEIRVITNTELMAGTEGLAAPLTPALIPTHTQKLASDLIQYYTRP